MSPSRRASIVVFVLIGLGTALPLACDGATLESADASHDAGPPTGDAGCVANPVVGEACSPSNPACTPGNACCEGVWACSESTHVWSLEQAKCVCQPDAASRPDVTTLRDAPPDTPIAPSTCAPPASTEAGANLGCADATCPTGTVCVQRDADVTSTAMCASIPASCGGAPTCACMGREAQECVEPGSPPQTDATPSFLDCQDETTGGKPYLDFPCGCA
jgi:hypothetical protein